MSNQEEFEGEIEFLDEDADIVQQCVLNVDNDTKVREREPGLQANSPRVVYEPRIERAEDKQERPKSKRKRPIPKDEDSDYDPAKDMDISNRTRKRRSNAPPTESRVRRIEFVAMPETTKKDRYNSNMDLIERRKLQIKVPDYDDPLCLPVRTLKKDIQEQRKLKNWNNLCLEHFKSYDTLLRVDQQPTVASKRIVVLNNIHNRINGKVETTMSAKLSIENKNGEKRTEVIQSVLPKYREKKLLNNIRLKEPKKHKTFYTKDEVVITKEVHKEEESLVVYKPFQSLSLVYKMFKNKDDGWLPENEDDPERRHLKEVASCKMCAPCYQTSWRGYKNTNNRKIPCMVCKRPCISMYNMLAHMKSHTNAAVRACKHEIAKCLADALEYHYKCRICDEKFLSIKSLRLHVRKHKSSENFKCEVCNQNIMAC